MKSITATVLRPTKIDITELTKSDLELVEKEQLLVITLGLIELLKEQSHTKVRPEAQTVLKTHPVAPKREEPTAVEATLFDAEAVVVPRTGHEGNIGFKYGTTSKYHYVCYNKQVKVNPWNAVVKIKGKNQSKFFKTEMEAALAIDIQLDYLGDTKRPRNRDEFPEVMEAYKSQQQQEEQR